MVSKLHTPQRGFSLVEVIVTLAITTIITTAVLVRFAVFDSVVILKNIAYEMALTVREAQVFAVSAAGDASGQFRRPYGFYADRSNPTQYLLFEDTNENFAYDLSDTIVTDFSMLEGFEIVEICDNGTSAGCDRNWVSLVFQRPEFDPTIVTSSNANATEARVRLAATRDPDITFSVLVGITGQISVETP